ncbi:MAG: 1-acyl-sn-glycerol-3-phosphate acyltransferase [Oceanococcus sp.]
MNERIPVLGEHVPRSGNAFTRGVGLFVFSLAGWRVEGNLPNLKKFILVAAPHTSNMDGIMGITGLLAMGFRANAMVKSDAFVGPLGWFLKAIGAIPVDRNSPLGVVEQTARAFQQRDAMVLLMAPEGTRKNAKEFKSGFHRMALAADVPVVPISINYEKKAAILGEPIKMQDDFDADLEKLIRIFRANSVARHPERLSLPMQQ